MKKEKRKNKQKNERWRERVSLWTQLPQDYYLPPLCGLPRCWSPLSNSEVGFVDPLEAWHSLIESREVIYFEQHSVMVCWDPSALYMKERGRGFSFLPPWGDYAYVLFLSRLFLPIKRLPSPLIWGVKERKGKERKGYRRGMCVLNRVCLYSDLTSFMFFMHEFSSMIQVLSCLSISFTLYLFSCDHIQSGLQYDILSSSLFQLIWGFAYVHKCPSSVVMTR